MKRYFYFLFVSAAILFFLFNSKITLEGSVNGLILWFNTVVPTLLPFMIMSSILIGLHGEKLLYKLLSPVTSKLLGLSPTGNYIFFIGMFCGYPLGAKTAADLLREKRITSGEAMYLMNFCNNISPVFTVSFICNTLLCNNKMVPYALLLLYGIPLILGLFTKKYYLRNTTVSTCYKQTTSPTSKTDILNILDYSILNAALTSLKLGGYIIIFSVFCSLIGHLHFLPEAIKTIFIILLEVTSGCRYCISSRFLLRTNLAIPALFACATFGGLSGIAQTSGMISDTGLSLKQYVLFRIVCSVVVFIISYLIF